MKLFKFVIVLFILISITEARRGSSSASRSSAYSRSSASYSRNSTAARPSTYTTYTKYSKPSNLTSGYSYKYRGDARYSGYDGYQTASTSKYYNYYAGKNYGSYNSRYGTKYSGKDDSSNRWNSAAGFNVSFVGSVVFIIYSLYWINFLEKNIS